MQGAGFASRFPAGDYDFEISENDIVSGLKVETERIVFQIGRVNPYIELGARLKIITDHAGLDEIVEVDKVGYRIMPGDERMTIYCVRQFTL